MEDKKANGHAGDELRKRRDEVFASEKAFSSGGVAGPVDRWGICLSGGGIRSATYSLGVMQALSRSPVQNTLEDTSPPTSYAGSLFSRFDYLSTVSGGGYVGSFIASMFIPGRLSVLSADNPQAAADAAVAALSQDPPGRIFSGDSNQPRTPATFPLAWLRENGRYLSPTGAGDMAYAAALDLRNWLAIHYVFGTVLVVLFSMLALLRGAMAAVWNLDPLPTCETVLWYSPFLWLALFPVVFWSVPVGLAFWFTYPSKGGTPRFLNWAIVAVIAIDALFTVLFMEYGVELLEPIHARVLLLGFGILVLTGSLLCYMLLWLGCDQKNKLASLRVLATRWLLASLQCILVLLALGVVETIGQSLYLLSFSTGLPPSIGSASGVAAILAWIAKHLMKTTSPTKPPAWIKKVPLTVIGGGVGILIFALLGCLWSFFVTAMVWDGQWPVESSQSVLLRAAIVAIAIVLALVTGQLPGFINLSSLQSFYSARLKRAYLGASNGARVRANPHDPKLSAAEPVEGDDVMLSDFCKPGDATPRTLAPFHIINTTLNKSVDPSEQLVQRDRKGQSLAVSPVGFLVDGAYNQFHETGSETEIQKTLSVGGWVGVSGAAASTGIGRNTSLGMSLLLGAANVRLGSWWESQAEGAKLKEGILRKAFRTQAYLLDEFTGKFHGLQRPWQYLTDGGHFENTGLYELLRPARNLRLAVVVDAGADPQYEFDDLANLVRLARIDFQVEVEVYRKPLPAPLTSVFGTPDDFRNQVLGIRLNKLTGPAAVVTQCAVLLRVTYQQRDAPAWVVLIKPRVLSDSTMDVRQYALTHASFPQETTGDQFFDEAQWESYRNLGLSNANAVFAHPVRNALETLMEEDIG